VSLADSYLLEAIHLASILVKRELEVLKVLAPCIRLVVGSPAAAHMAPDEEVARRMAAAVVDSLLDSLAVVENIPAAVGGSLVVHMAVAEDIL
jgi:hypothetical protein